MTKDYVVKDIALAEFGRKELDIAETEMPGPDGAARGIRRKQTAGRITHCWLAPYDDPDRSSDRNALLPWGLMCAGRRAISFPRRITPLHAIALGGTPVFAIKGQSLEEHWDYLDRSFMFEDGPNLILDDGGDATLYVLLGARAEAGEEIIPVPTSEEEEAIKAQIKKRMTASPGWFTENPAIRSRASAKRRQPACIVFTISSNKGNCRSLRSM